jgi:hypothetical protein
MSNVITHKWWCAFCGLVLEFFNPKGVSASIEDVGEVNYINRRCPICRTDRRFFVI